MARRVFFSFHYDGDVWRANQVRNANVVAGADVAGSSTIPNTRRRRKREQKESRG